MKLCNSKDRTGLTYKIFCSSNEAFKTNRSHKRSARFLLIYPKGM